MGLFVRVYYWSTTVPNLSIYEIYRPQGDDVVTVFEYFWNGLIRTRINQEMSDEVD